MDPCLSWSGESGKPAGCSFSVSGCSKSFEDVWNCTEFNGGAPEHTFNSLFFSERVFNDQKRDPTTWSSMLHLHFCSTYQFPCLYVLCLVNPRRPCESMLSLVVAFFYFLDTHTSSPFVQGWRSITILIHFWIVFLYLSVWYFLSRRRKGSWVWQSCI